MVMGADKGAEPAAFGGYAPAGGPPVRALPPWRRTRVRVITGIVIAVLVVLGFVLQHLAGTGARGSVRLPGTLLGVSENTSPAARALDRTFVRRVVVHSHAKVLHPVADVYGGSSGPGFVVAGGGACGTCAPKSAAATLRRYRTRYPGARLFPPGRNGGALICAPLGSVFGCWWYDDMTGGAVAYFGGSASGLADAAAKTNQIRAAVEH